MERSCFLSGGQGDSLFFSGPRFAQAIAAFSYGTRGLEGLPEQLLWVLCETYYIPLSNFIIFFLFILILLESYVTHAY